MTPATAIAILEALLRADLGLKPQTQDRYGHHRGRGYLQSRERNAIRLAVAALARQYEKEAHA